MYIFDSLRPLSIIYKDITITHLGHIYLIMWFMDFFSQRVETLARRHAGIKIKNIHVLAKITSLLYTKIVQLLIEATKRHASKNITNIIAAK